MNRNKILGIILAVQVVLALLYLLSGSRLQSHSGITRLLEMDPGQVNRVVIEDSEGSVAELQQKDEKWVTSEDFPINQDRIQNLLQDVSELEHGLAVATTPSAAKRFKVADDEFERHVRLLNGDKVLGEFYLGSGAGARKNHIRLAGDASIYVAGLASYAVPGDIGDWQDKEQLQIERDEVFAIRLDGITITRNPGAEESAESGDTGAAAVAPPAWTTDALGEDETLNVESLEEHLENLVNLRYDMAFKGSLDESTETPAVPVREITISHGDQQRTYQFYPAREGSGYILNVSDKEELFKISEYNGNRIIENLNAGALIRKPEPEGDSSQSESSQVPAATNEPEINMPWMPGN